MRRVKILAGLALMGMALSACSSADLSAIPRVAENLPSSVRPASLAATISAAVTPARPPSGFVDFCNRNPVECQAHPDQPDLITLTDKTRAMLQEVNLVVNTAVHPMDDSEHYAVTEYWTVPVDGEGDCEDYVLAKRKMLVLLGLPEPALRITVVLNEEKVRHAVLTVVTDKGDYVLDSLRDDVAPRDQVPYTWLERQDSASRTGWVAMN